MKCARCNTPTTSGGNRLLITFDGGYGDFIDILPGEHEPHTVLCGGCAHVLVADNPWLLKVLRLDRAVKLNGDNGSGDADISGHNTGCFCWAGSSAKARFDEEIERQRADYEASKAD